MATAPLTRTSHASGLHAVERELAQLHGAMLRSGGEDARMVRLSVLTLVAVCSDEEGARRAEEVVTRLASAHPARAIIIVADPSAEGGVEADLSLHCVTDRGGAQVCVEQVRLRVAGERGDHLASVVTPLLVADVPVYVWLVGAPALEGAFGHQAVAVAERLIIDSGAYPDPPATLARLAEEETAQQDALPVVDLAWARTQPWRELLASCFDGTQLRRFLRSIRSVEVVTSGEAPSAQAWLVLGWLASKLGWPDGGGPALAAVSRPVDDVPAHDLVALRVGCAGDGGGATVSIERRGDALACTIAVDHGLSASSSVAFPTAAMVELVVRQLEDAAPDRTYPAALHRAAVLAAAGA
ncbi:MAG: glucose-6-phosphate dehydrogenase assembly protein OpcA [Candidatus Dormibacteria bacterium]